MKHSSGGYLFMCLLIAVAGATQAVHAADLTGLARPGATRPANIYRIDGVYLDEGQIVLDDRMFHLNSSTFVYRPNGSIGALTDLRKGMRVNIQALHESPQPLLTQIRILP